MESKTHGLDPKVKQTSSHDSSVNQGRLNEILSEAFGKTRRRINAVDRIIETYRGILRHIHDQVTFDDTIQAMVSLGYYASGTTKAELKALFDLEMHALKQRRCYEA